MIMKSILIVSPDPETASILRLRLELEGYKVVSAIDKEETLEQAGKDSPCLAVIDMINSDEEETRETSQIISALHKKKIKTAVLLPRMKENSRVFSLPKSDIVVRKPYNIETLAKQLRNLLSSPRRSCSSHRD